METGNLLEVLGTLGAGGTGLVGILLLIRALWKLISGQLAEQRNLLADARSGTAAVAEERDKLRARVDSLREQLYEDAKRKDAVIDGLNDRLVLEGNYSRRLAEYASYLRSRLIEDCNQDPDTIRRFPKRGK